ncbi:MAG: biosynthetic-type acetolactate synthase large subunit [Candidatus Dadabacteria bacterium]|nr:MAG: biosynthetic-type acetolactate synthase large subunit [Candidatus Dadabacteria bacterium]
MELTGAEIFVESLRKEGVHTIFGYPGGVVLNIYDVLYDSDIRHILVRHEQAAVHAADGYARATGEVGVALVTSGPGATNTVTGLATAYMDSVPLVVFTGQVPTHLIGNDAFQEADIVGITRPCTKHNYLVKDVRDLARIIKEAFYLARSGRPGPVLVDLPKDVIVGKTEYVYPEAAKLRGYNPTYEGHLGQIKKALKAIHEARRPVVYAGGGVILSNAARELTEFARRLKLPVTTTLMGLGGFPGSDPLFLGMLGMHGTYRANMAVSHADLLVAVGARFDDRVTGKIDEFAPNAKIIHVDIDPTSISKNVQVDIPIVGDAKNVLKKMLGLVHGPEWENRDEALADWHAEIEVWAAAHKMDYGQGPDVIKPQYVVEQLHEATGGRCIVSTEVGQNQMWAAQYFRLEEPRCWLTSGGLGTMGYGFPAAIGAQAAFPDRIVIDIAGDGSIQMNIQELATAVQYKLPVKVAILNNGFLGMVRQWQELFYDRRYSHTRMEVAPDFVKLAEAYGALGLRATRPEEVRPVIEKALAHPGPVLMDFHVDPEEGVYPMVPAGAPLTKMLLL